MSKPDVPGALARLWSAYPHAGAAREELRMVFALLGAEPPEPDHGTERCRVCSSVDGYCTIYACARQLKLVE